MTFHPLPSLYHITVVCSGYEVEEDLISPVSLESPIDSSVHGNHLVSTVMGRHVTSMDYNGSAARGASDSDYDDSCYAGKHDKSGSCGDAAAQVLEM